ncbi:hypothetical protein [Mycoplasma sp. 1654_15]|uniref:hypothetical protein n=1 Tax=Mycoplasma sp. 1654_15 TaxID=2725994 RepID=UPI001448AE50|nr:hypothetical protein [Mycoplasma sp. 1654_15]QJB71009.1 hypothetical protein HF996_00545 [Mycoplasma sp. 1654_15]
MDLKTLIWRKYFDNCELAFDFSGRKMKFSDFENEDSDFSWTLDFMRAQKLNGPENELNIIPVHIKTKKEKADNINFLANGRFFQVKKVLYRPDKEKNLLYFITMQNSHIENIELENKLAYNYYWNKFNKFLSLDFIETNDLIDYDDPEKIC